MSDAIKHECGIAMVRLLKPLEYYRKKYGDVFWGMNKLYLLMEKQHNRGQEGAGMASVKLNARPGEEYIFRERAEGTGAIQDIFSAVHRAITECRRIEPEVPDEELPFIGEMYMGHLRYSTTGRSGISYLHPFLRRNNWRSRNLSLAGNFNLTNVDEILQYIVERGQHPRHNADTFIILEQLGYLLDYEVEHLYRRFKAEGLAGQAMNDAIEENIDIEHILQEAGADRSHIVMCRVFITDMSKWDEANAAYAEFFGEHKPARAIYEVRRTHHMAQIEVEAIAEV